MTRDILASAMAALARRLDARVELVHAVVAPDGKVLRRVHGGWFDMPADWKPPTPGELLAHAKRGRE
jgi:hypothetical protein